MSKGIVIRSASFEPGGEEAREAHTKAAVEAAGYELPPEPLPERDDDRALTPEQRQEQNLKDYFGGQLKHAKQKYEDFDAVVNQNIFIGVEVQKALLSMPNAAEVVYALGRQPALARKIGETCKTNPQAAIAEVRKLSQHVPAPERVSTRPVRPSEKALEDMTFAEVAALPKYPGKTRDLRRCRGR